MPLVRLRAQGSPTVVKKVLPSRWADLVKLAENVVHGQRVDALTDASDGAVVDDMGA